MEIGFKGFDKDLCCKGVRYIPGATMPRIKRIKLCKRGYHFCRELKDLALWQWYRVDRASGNRFAIVEPSGKIIDDVAKSVAQEIRIIREMMIDEVEELINCGGLNNYGVGNSGEENRGNMNYGTRNIGSWNIGDYNKGICNIGSTNIGSFNTGNNNHGGFNAASDCQGWFNTKAGCRGYFNVEGVKYARVPTLLSEMLYGWRNYVTLTIMVRNNEFDSERIIYKPWNRMQKRMYVLVKWNDVKTAIRHSTSMIISDCAGLAMDLWNLKEELVSMKKFNWDIFEEITGISEKWLDMEIEKEIEAR